MSENVFTPPDSDILGEPPRRREENELSRAVMDSLMKTRPFVLFMSIIGFLMVAIIVVFSVFIMVVGVGAGAGFGLAFSGLYLLFGLLYFIPSMHLFRFASTVKMVAQNGNVAVELALEYMRKFWKYTAIMMLCVIFIYVLAIGAAVLIPLMTAGQ